MAVSLIDTLRYASHAALVPVPLASPPMLKAVCKAVDAAITELRNRGFLMRNFRIAEYLFLVIVFEMLVLN
jgi:hypothetical protein